MAGGVGQRLKIALRGFRKVFSEVHMQVLAGLPTLREAYRIRVSF